jgi:hypothetical protein
MLFSIIVIFISCTFFYSKFLLPQAVEVAVLVHGYGSHIAATEFGYGGVLEVGPHTANSRLDIDERDVVLGGHRVMHTAYLDTENAVGRPCDMGYMLLDTCIDGVCLQLGHGLATTHQGNTRIDKLLYYIATMGTFIKLYCHNE